MNATTRIESPINPPSRTVRILRDALSAIGIGAGAALALTLILAAPAIAAGSSAAVADIGEGEGPVVVSCTLVSMPGVPTCDGSVR